MISHHSSFRRAPFFRPGPAAFLAGLLTLSASAAQFTASNETEFLQAIDDANASSDPNSTITLTDSFTITGSGLSRIEKDLVIDMAGHKLTSSFDTTFDVAQGATLVLDGSFDVVGVTGFSGNMIKTGEGTLRIKGGPSDIFWRVKTEEGLFIFDEGAVVTFGDYFGDVPNTVSMSDVAAGIRVTGPGTVVTNRFTTVLQSPTGASINVDNGATFNSMGLRLGALTDTTGILNVDAAQVNIDDAYVQAGTGEINVFGGGQMHTNTTATGVVINNSGIGIQDRGGTGHFLIAGDGSRWVNDGFFMMTRGSLKVLDGGSLETAALRAGFFDNQLEVDAIADILVSGAGSSLKVTAQEAGLGHIPQAFVVGGGVGDVEKAASLTIADHAVVDVENGHGTVHVATLPSSTGTINIGGRKGEDADIAGYLNAGSVAFGPGSGELNFNHTNNNYAFDIPLFGNGSVNQIGPGRTTLTANQTLFTGLTTVTSGTLTVQGVLGGTVDLKGGMLNGNGTVGSLTQENGSVIAPGTSIGTLTIDGDYTGNGGLVRIETVLGDDNSPTDRLKITGDSSGRANVAVINLNGNGAPTSEGIKIIDIDGASNARFTLLGDYLLDHQPAIVAGAYAYRLYKNGLATPMDGDWYLRSIVTDGGGGDADDNGGDGGDSGNGGDDGNGGGNGSGGGNRDGGDAHPNPAPLYQAGVPLYQSQLGIMQTLNSPQTLQQRTGNRHPAYDYGAYPALRGSLDGIGQVHDRPTVWNRINVAHAHASPETATAQGTEYSLNSWRFDTGIDGLLVVNDGRLIGGLSAHHLRSTANVVSGHGNGKLDITGTGFGATLTWYDDTGFYLDGSAQATWYRMDLLSTTASRFLTRDNRGFGYALSAETGVRVDLNDRFSVIPQAQLTYSSVIFEPFTDSFGARVSPHRSESLTARFGLEANYGSFWEDSDGRAGANLYSVMNVHYALLGRNTVNVSGANFHSDEPKARASFGIGGSLNWGNGKFTAHAELTHQFALSGKRARDHVTKGQLGLRIRF